MISLSDSGRSVVPIARMKYIPIMIVASFLAPQTIWAMRLA